MQDGHFLLPLLLPGNLLDTACFFGLALCHLLAALEAVAESKVGGVAGGVVAVVTVVGAGAGYRVGGLVALVAELGAALAAGIASEVEDAFVVGQWLLQTGAAVPAVPVR